MAGLLAGVTIPGILSGAYSALLAAYNLYSTTKSRREQVKVMLSRCEDLVAETAKRTQNGSDIALDAERIQSACESVKGLIENLNKKGFTWCLLNADKIDGQVQMSKERIQDAFMIFGFHAHFDIATFQSDLIRAQIQDKEDLSALLNKLAENDRQILYAIQDQSGVHKRFEDLLIGIYKHVQHMPTTDELTPENRFLRTAADTLGRKYDISTDRKFAAYILSSFEVEENEDSLIGSGAMGKVFTGEWRGSVVAIKRMHIQDARVINDKDRRTLRHEVKIWATLHHENILPLYGACPDADVPFLVMKYCPDGDVRHYLQENPSADRLRLTCDVAVGLAFLHSKSVVHADIKGMNVLVNGEHRALLTDFGLSIVMNDIKSRSTYSKELQDKARGTMAWMAPEVHSGSQPDMAADVYSLAMTIWEIFSDQNPFSGTRIDALSDVVRHGARPPRSPGFLKDDEVWDIVQDCWAHDPKSRPESTEAMRRLKCLIKTDIPSSAPRVDAGFFGDSVVQPLSKIEMPSGNWEYGTNNGSSSNFSIGASWTTAKGELSTSDFMTSAVEGIDHNAKRDLSATIPPGVITNGNSVLSTRKPSTPDPEDPIWTSIVQALPPQWKHVKWGARNYLDEVTIPFVLTDKPYKYRILSGRSDLGIHETYELNPDGSQRINFLEYNKGYGIIDTIHVKVFVVDPDGTEALVAYWNPNDKPLANVESEYARQVRAGGVHWGTDSSSVSSVTLNRVLNNKDYKFRVLCGDTDLGVQPAGQPTADKALTIDLAAYNGGLGIPIQSLIKVLVVDPDVEGAGTLVAGWWPTPPGPKQNGSSGGKLDIPFTSHLPSSSSATGMAYSTPALSFTSSPALNLTPSSTPLPSSTPSPSPSASSLASSSRPSITVGSPPPVSVPAPHAKKKYFWQRK